jgi:hypothetical protein
MTVIGNLPWGKIFKAKKIAEALWKAGKALFSFFEELKWAKAILRGAERAAEAAKAAAAAAAKAAAERAAAAKALAERLAKKAAEEAEARAKALAARAKAALKKGADDAQHAGESCLVKHSFAAGTLVLLADRTTKSIDQLQPGETVLATDPVTGQTQARQIVRTIRTTDDTQFVALVVRDATGAGQTITTTFRGAHEWHDRGGSGDAGKAKHPAGGRHRALVDRRRAQGLGRADLARASGRRPGPGQRKDQTQRERRDQRPQRQPGCEVGRGETDPGQPVRERWRGRGSERAAGESAKHTHAERLAEHQPADLPRRGSGGTQQRELPPTLGHGEREGAGNDEGGHEGGDTGRLAQQGAGGQQQARVRIHLGGATGVAREYPYLRPFGQRGAHSGGSASAGTDTSTVSTSTTDGVTCPTSDGPTRCQTTIRSSHCSHPRPSHRTTWRNPQVDTGPGRTRRTGSSRCRAGWSSNC